MPWMTILEWGLKLVGWIIGKRAEDQETKRKFLELTHHIQAKGLVSARFRVEMDDRLDRLEKKRLEAKKKLEEKRRNQNQG